MLHLSEHLMALKCGMQLLFLELVCIFWCFFKFIFVLHSFNVRTIFSAVTLQISPLMLSYIFYFPTKEDVKVNNLQMWRHGFSVLI